MSPMRILVTNDDGEHYCKCKQRGPDDRDAGPAASSRRDGPGYFLLRYVSYDGRL